MIFESIDYFFAIQDVLFSLGAGYAVGFFAQILSVFLYKGRIRMFIKDILVSFVFAVVMFSYVISFTNYPVIRIYHILGGIMGYFCFSLQFSVFFQKISEKIFLFLKNKMLCYGKKVSSTICGLKQKMQKKSKSAKQQEENGPLKKEAELLYNL